MVLLLRALLSVLLGGAAFYLARLELQTLLSFIIGAAVSVVAFASGILDFVKRFLEIQKLNREKEESARLLQEKSRMVQPATPQEVKDYVIAHFERKVGIRKIDAQKETLHTKTFLERVDTERRTDE